MGSDSTLKKIRHTVKKKTKQKTHEVNVEFERSLNECPYLSLQTTWEGRWTASLKCLYSLHSYRHAYEEQGVQAHNLVCFFFFVGLFFTQARTANRSTRSLLRVVQLWLQQSAHADGGSVVVFYSQGAQRCQQI